MAELTREVSFDLRVQVDEVDDHFVAKTVPFNFTAVGETAEEAEKRVNDAVEAFVKNLLVRDTVVDHFDALDLPHTYAQTLELSDEEEAEMMKQAAKANKSKKAAAPAKSTKKASLTPPSLPRHHRTVDERFRLSVPVS